MEHAMDAPRSCLPVFDDDETNRETSSELAVLGRKTDEKHSSLSPEYGSNSMQPVASAANHHHHHHSEDSAACFRWPPSSRVNGASDERATYFGGLQKDLCPHEHVLEPSPQYYINQGFRRQARTLLDLMTIRAFHNKLLRQFSLGTAIGFRTRRGILTDIPAIVVFVARKVHKQWLHELESLPAVLEGPGNVWCDVDVVEFSYYGTPAVAPKEQVYTELVEDLRGNDPCIGPGSQVASQGKYGTLGAIVQSKIGSRKIGFLTNRHVAVDLDYPSQKMFHPLPPNLGPGVYLGSVERATSFITDELWYGIFASMNSETFVRADGAFIPFGDSFDMSRVSATVKGVGDMGDVMCIDLQAPVGSVVGRNVIKVGRSSGLTEGRIMAYAVEYNDEKGNCFFTDFLIVGEKRQAFDLEGDSGSLILTTEGGGGKPRPMGMIWGGMANRGWLKRYNVCEPENWTSGVDLGRLLDFLQLSLITCNEELAAAVEEKMQTAVEEKMQTTVATAAAGGGSGMDQETRIMVAPLLKDQGKTLDEDIVVASVVEQQHTPDLPIATLVDSTESTPATDAPTAATTSTNPTKELDLLDFGIAPRDVVQPHDIESLSNYNDTTHSSSSTSDNNTRNNNNHNNNNSNTEELSFCLQLFNRDAKKRRP